MKIEFENLEKITDIYNLLIQLRDREMKKVEKRWLTTEELSCYIGYSKDSINKLIQKEEFICGVHYYKKLRKILFLKEEIDNWIMGTSKANNTDYITDNIINDIAI